MQDKLRSLDGDATMSYTINLNSQHDGPSLQPVLEAPLEKKSGECGWLGGGWVVVVVTAGWKWGGGLQMQVQWQPGSALACAACSMPQIASLPLPPTPTGMRFGPPGSKRLIYFADGLNMPSVDKYDTQSAVELLRQSIDYHGW